MNIFPEDIAEKLMRNEYTISKKRDRKSIVWEVYGHILNENGETIPGFVGCKNCHHVAKYAGQSTTNLLSHSCVKVLKTGPKNEVKITTEDKKSVLNACTQMCIRDLRPFTIVDGNGFLETARLLVKMGARYGEHVDVKYMVPASTTVGNSVDSIVEKIIPEIKADIENTENVVFGCTTDLWTDDYQKRGFIGVTIQYIKADKMIERVLAVEEITDKHTGENILAKLKQILGRFSFDNFSRIVFVTDRGANIIKALEQETRISCADHLINNILSKASDQTPELVKLFKVCSKLVRYTKKSNTFSQLETSLKADCPTRWNTKHDMCKSILANIGQLTTLLHENQQIQRLDGITAPLLTEIVNFLEIFKKGTVEMEKSCEPTLHLVFPYFITFLKKCGDSPSDSEIIKQFKKHVKDQLDTVMLPNIKTRHHAATFLYPPCRLMPMLSAAEKVDMIGFIKSQIDIQAAANDHNEGEAVPARDIFEAFSAPAPSSSGASSANAIFDEFGAAEPIDLLDDEIKKYMLHAMDNLETDIVKILEWWATNKKSYPYLYQAHLKINCVPATSAASERIFSEGGNIVSEKRSRLSAKRVNNLIVANSYSKTKSLPT